MNTDHTLYDPGLRAALRQVAEYPTKEARLQRLAELDREAVAKGYRRSPEDMSLMSLAGRAAAAAKWRGL